MRNPYKQANQLIGALKFAGIKAEIVGGIYKCKPNPHDIDFVVESGVVGSIDELLASLMNAVCKDVEEEDFTPVEFYLADREYYEKLKAALRAHRHQVIKNKMMSGLHFRKLVFYKGVPPSEVETQTVYRSPNELNKSFNR